MMDAHRTSLLIFNLCIISPSSLSFSFFPSHPQPLLMFSSILLSIITWLAWIITKSSYNFIILHVIAHLCFSNIITIESCDLLSDMENLAVLILLSEPLQRWRHCSRNCSENQWAGLIVLSHSIKTQISFHSSLLHPTLTLPLFLIISDENAIRGEHLREWKSFLAVNMRRQGKRRIAERRKWMIG